MLPPMATTWTTLTRGCGLLLLSYYRPPLLAWVVRTQPRKDEVHAGVAFTVGTLAPLALFKPLYLDDILFRANFCAWARRGHPAKMSEEPDVASGMVRGQTGR